MTMTLSGWRFLFALCLVVVLILTIWGAIFTWNMTRWEMFTRGWPFTVSIIILCLAAAWIGGKI